MNINKLDESNPLFKAMFEELYNSMTIEELAKKLKKCKKTVHNIRFRLGIKMKGRGRRKVK